MCVPATLTLPKNIGKWHAKWHTCNNERFVADESDTSGQLIPAVVDALGGLQFHFNGVYLATSFLHHPLSTILSPIH